jgi:hypothetical protein
VPKRAIPFVDAVLRWVVREAEAGERRGEAVGRRLELRARPADAVLLVAVVLPALTLGL